MKRRLHLLLGALLVVAVGLAPSASAESYQRISGEGSSWAANAIDAMRVNVKQFGMTVDYNPSGSSAGRKNFLNGTVDFAASDIPFQFHPEDGSAPENPAPGSYAYMPITAGGTSFMYNLKINGQRVTNLRLSGENASKIFTGVITSWDDPAIAADNPGLQLPARKVVPVVRSDGSGSTAQFTLWMIHEHPDVWTSYCKRSGRAPACGSTSFYPTIPGMIAQSGDLGVSGYVAQNFAEGAIGYVNYSYALGAQFPVVKVLNHAGYYTEPTPENVAVSLLQAQINTDQNSDEFLTQKLEGVYTDADKRNYPLSSYSYLILPTKVVGQFNEAKGKTLGAFSYYAMCQAQEQSASLGYSPMPINLVQASFEQIRRIPGVVVQDIDIKSCHNPTFSADGTNLLADNAPQPQECDKQGPTQCATGTGGVKKVSTPVKSTSAASAAPGADAGGPGGGGSAIGTGPSGRTLPGPAAKAATTKTSSTPAAGASAVDAPPSADPGAATCDADTGCQSASPASGGVSIANDAQVAAATATLLPVSAGWTDTQSMIALVLLMGVGLLLAPALAWRRFASSDERSR